MIFVYQQRPVYLSLPTNLVSAKISSTPLRKTITTHPAPNDPETELYVIREIERLAKDAEGDVIILVDACAIRNKTRNEVLDLCEKTGFPVYASPMGKTAISEEYERYGGVSLVFFTSPGN